MQSGANKWTIAFDDYKLPEMKDKNGKAVPLKGNYSLKIQVWAAGTYQADTFGEPILDSKGRIQPIYTAAKKPVAKTKPVTVTVKVKLK